MFKKDVNIYFFEERSQLRIHNTTITTFKKSPYKKKKKREIGSSLLGQLSGKAFS